MLRKIWYFFCSSCKPHQNKTVRLAFPITIITALVMGAAVVMTEEQSFVTIKTMPVKVFDGDSFTMTVSATAHMPINAVDIVIAYPENQMEITGIDTGESVITLWTKEPYALNGEIYLRGGTFQKGFLGEHVIAKVKAKAIQSGTAHVTTNSIRFIAGDGLGTDIPITEDSEGEAKIYIANADGSLVGSASVNIVTDLDGDGDVDLKDISAFMASWFRNDNLFDFNGDGRTTFKDFSILLADSFFR